MKVTGKPDKFIVSLNDEEWNIVKTAMQGDVKTLEMEARGYERKGRYSLAMFARKQRGTLADLLDTVTEEIGRLV